MKVNKKIILLAFVFNGAILRPHAMPWLTKILIPGSGCTGSIIGKRHILTAGHCGIVRGSKSTHVGVGAHDLKGIGQVGKKIRIKKFEVFTNSGPLDVHARNGPYDIDVVVITLDEDIPLDRYPLSMKKAKLGSTSDTACAKCTSSCSMVLDASGWGDDPSDRGIL